VKKKNTPLYVPVLFAFATGTWIITVCISINRGETQGFLFVMQCACIVSSGAAAVANFIRHKRSKNNKEKEE